MSEGNRNFIYAYDNDQQQIIIINAETGERVEPKDNRVLSILTYLREQDDTIKLRKFSLWCASETTAHIKPIQKKMLDLAQQTIKNEIDSQELHALYEQTESEAIATDTVGLRQGSRQAPGFLAARECINPNAFAGAKNASRFHLLWAEMNDESNAVSASLKELGPVTSENALARAEQEQVDCLLDLIGGNEK